ncbi:MAG: YicC/YloC family endoribonuclease [Bacteroidales bacterium]
MKNYRVIRRSRIRIMLLSMTGWGKARYETAIRKVSVEIKSLNSKQLDLNIKCPQVYRERELEIRNEIAGAAQRGKVDLIISQELIETAVAATLNREVLQQYVRQVQSAVEGMDIPISEATLAALLKLPDTFHYPPTEADDTEWQYLKNAIGEALTGLYQFRKQEGEQLEKDIRNRIQLIAEGLDRITPFELSRIEKIRARLQSNLNEFLGKDKVDTNRFEQEVIFYLEKIDITEEKVRLANHLKFFIETIGAEEYPGKKLGFIAQEIGREINTIGSKANDSDIQKIVVGMKDELEKIKEQLLNII